MTDETVVPAATSVDRSPPTGAAGLARGLVGGVLGGLFAAVLIAAFTTLIKTNLDWIMGQSTWVLVLFPFLGLAISVLLLNVVARGQAVQQVPDVYARPPRAFTAWLRFPASAVRADLTADVVGTAGAEERFPWRLAPIRAAAILATVGMGAPMGTESPAAHLGVATGVAAGRRRRTLVRSAGIGGGAAAVAVLMGLPLVGAVFVLELGRRNHAALNPVRVLAAAAGALVGWGVNAALDLQLIRLIVPEIAAGGLVRAFATAAAVGALAGAFGSLTGAVIYQARAWSAHPAVKFLAGGAVLAVCMALIAKIATVGAAIGPGASTVGWAEAGTASAAALLLVVLLRAAATAAAVLAGGCGGLFVPLLAIGDLTGRALAPGLGVPGELAASAGAAGAIAGGYRLPLTAVAMVLTLGGPTPARLTCVAAVAFATAAGIAASYLLDRYVLHRGAMGRTSAH